MFALFQVFFLGAAVASSDSLVVSVVEWVSVFPGPVGGGLNWARCLVGEGEVGAVRGEVGVESAALLDDVVEGLITVEDLAVLFGVGVASLVLRTLERLVMVADLVHVGEGFGGDGGKEARKGLGDWAWVRTVVHVLKFGSLHEFLRAAVGEGLSSSGLTLTAHGSVDVAGSTASGASLSEVVLAGVDVRVSNGVALQPFEGIFWLAARVDDYFLIGTNFVAFLTCRQTIGDLKAETVMSNIRNYG